MKPLGIVLVHGYTGSPDEMAPLDGILGRHFGNDSVLSVCLPGHGGTSTPGFDAEGFETRVADACAALRNEGRRLVIIGHSTGGSLAMGSLISHNIIPAMLVLAGTPARIEGKDLVRWEHHRRDREPVALGDVSRMVSYVNRVGRTHWKTSFPVLLLSGAKDTLVPAARVDLWRSGRLLGTVQHIAFPEAGHDLFTGPGGRAAADCIYRALSNLRDPTLSELASIRHLGKLEPGVQIYIETDPTRARHLSNSPAAMRAQGADFIFAPGIATDPIQLNIEITSRCNLTCHHCARARRRRSGKDMDLGVFEYLLDLMPNTYKVMMVGLGEPTLHPRVASFVAEATARGHHIGMVTNAMALDKALSKRLVRAGLRSITFSLDCVDDAMAAAVRGGSDVARIRANIDGFIDQSAGSIPAAVFSAVSANTIDHLPKVAEVVAQLGVKAWMVSDLNFEANRKASISKNWCDGFRDSIGRAIKTAYRHQVPILSVRGIEELGLTSRYHGFLLTSPAELGRRSVKHRWCLSPWQTLPVDVNGNVTFCDCQPEAVVGNLIKDGMSEIWNGRVMQARRRSMLSDRPPRACRICPRF